MKFGFFCMEQRGHLRRLAPIAAGLRSLGCEIFVFTHRSLEDEVDKMGGVFQDLFQGRVLDDSGSAPLGFRCVTFGGDYAWEVAELVRPLSLDCIVYASFAVVGGAVAKLLDIPEVCVYSGHNLQPATYREILQFFPAVNVSPRCHRAIERLRKIEGLEAANEFLFTGVPGPLGNIYCEPQEYLGPQERQVFEPAFFFGSLNEPLLAPRAEKRHSESLVYASFGTLAPKYFSSEVEAALEQTVRFFAGKPGFHLHVGLGGAEDIYQRSDTWNGPNVTVELFASQAEILQKADLFLTHHGMKSTHEAIYHQVPMLSYPFFVDQPLLARRCQEMGLAFPLVDTVREPLSGESLARGLSRWSGDIPGVRHRLQEASCWEVRTVTARTQILKTLVERLEARH